MSSNSWTWDIRQTVAKFFHIRPKLYKFIKRSWNSIKTHNKSSTNLDTYHSIILNSFKKDSINSNKNLVICMRTWIWLPKDSKSNNRKEKIWYKITRLTQFHAWEKQIHSVGATILMSYRCSRNSSKKEESKAVHNSSSLVHHLSRISKTMAHSSHSLSAFHTPNVQTHQILVIGNTHPTFQNNWVICQLNHCKSHRISFKTQISDIPHPRTKCISARISKFWSGKAYLSNHQAKNQTYCQIRQKALHSLFFRNRQLPLILMKKKDPVHPGQGET